MQVEREAPSGVGSGARVSNAYAIYLTQENSPGKLGLMLHGPALLHGSVGKDLFRCKMSVRTIS